MNLVDLIVVERQSGYFGQAPELSVFNHRDVVLSKVDMIKFPQLAHSFHWNFLELVIGKNEMPESFCER